MAAHFFECAVGAHLAGDRDEASTFFRKANLDSLRLWLDALWGSVSRYPDQVHYRRFREVPELPEKIRFARDRMPDAATRRALIERDGYHCRYCGIPVVPAEVRKAVHLEYSDAVPWGASNSAQHAGFQCLWLQFDHVVPHAYGGDNSLDNLVIACAGCNFGKSSDMIEQLGLVHPLVHPAVRTNWDGLTRLLDS